MTKKSKSRISLPPFSPVEILQALKAKKGRAVTFTEIAQALEVDPSWRKELRQTLRDLIEERKIVRIDRRHYGLPSSKQVVIGRVQAHRGGYGFLIPEDTSLPDIFLSRQESRDLMHRDRVALHLAKKERGRRKAPRVVEVLERAHHRVVGRYEEGSRCDWVIPDETRLVQPIRIPKKASGGAKTNQIVLAQISHYPTPKEGPFF